MNTIISKRTGTFTYTKWVNSNGQYRQDGPGIVINGGAGIVGGAELLSGIPLERRSSIIPVGVHTYVDDEVLEKLMSIGKFRHDLKRGIICVVKGKKCDQDATDRIAGSDMIEDYNIPSRPVSEKEILDAGGIKNRDGSIDIADVNDGDSPIRQRVLNAGLPSYVQKREAENRKRENRERKNSRRTTKR